MDKKNKKPKSKTSRPQPDKKQPASRLAAATPDTTTIARPAITHLLRIEAINIGAVCDDTDDISIRRGGSLLVRQAVIDAGAWLGEHLSQDRFEPVSVGASIGTYGLKLEPRDNPQTLIEKLADYINKDEHYRLACFALAICPYESDYHLIREKLLAQIRYQQLRQPGRYAPPPSVSQDGVCDFDHLSPGAKKTIKKQQRHIGESAKLRFEYGRDRRQKFYQEELKGFNDLPAINLDALKFTDDLHELSHNPGFENLSDKIALIYFDGNGFSAEQRDYGKTVSAQKNFDAGVREKRRAFLADLITCAADDPHFRTDAGELRLEVLTWGGDEFLLVVPAWQGWEVTQRFLNRHAPGFEFTGDNGVRRRLTHAGGLVFCGAKTPIARVRDLARNLANLIKARKDNKDKNSFAYLVLESVDYPANGIDAYFKQRYGEMAPHEFTEASTFPLLASTLDHETVTELLSKVSSGLLHALGTAAARDGPESDAYKKQWERAEQILGANNLEKAQGWLDQLFPNQKRVPHWQWLHLLELRDYLAPQPKLAGTRKEIVP